MHVLTVVAENLSPAHLLVAVKHWVAKFEQEIMNTDTGPADRGAYEFEHEGAPVAVHWNPVSTVNHMQPQSGGGSDSSDEPEGNEEPLLPTPSIAAVAASPRAKPAQSPKSKPRGS
jgi:hypothetical protein